MQGSYDQATQPPAQDILKGLLQMLPLPLLSVKLFLGHSEWPGKSCSFLCKAYRHCWCHPWSSAIRAHWLEGVPTAPRGPRPWLFLSTPDAAHALVSPTDWLLCRKAFGPTHLPLNVKVECCLLRKPERRPSSLSLNTLCLSVIGQLFPFLSRVESLFCRNPF